MTTHSNRISFSPTNVKTHIKLDNILSNHRPSVGQCATTFSRLILMMMFALAMKTAEAKVVRVEVEERLLLENGHFLGNVGQYEKIRGTIHYKDDTENHANAAIVDLEFAPKNVRGMVEFSGDFMLLRSFLIMMDDWVSKEIEPTDSKYPRIDRDELITAAEHNQLMQKRKTGHQ